MKREIKDILRKIYEIIYINGNPYLEKIFINHIDNTEDLYGALENYERGIYNETRENEEGEEEIDKPSDGIKKFIYLNGVVIDSGNIGRIELDFEYNPKRNKNTYFIRIIKKFPSPLEEDFRIDFNSEEDRDFGYEVLKGKLKFCNVTII